MEVTHGNLTTGKKVYKHYFSERKAILDSALILIKEGKFNQLSMTEIFFHARLSSRTALQFFPTLEKLIEALQAHVLSQVAEQFVDGTINVENPKVSIQNAAVVLYKFYLRNPGIFRFIDQISLINNRPRSVSQFHNELNQPIENFLHNMAPNFPSSITASLIHSRILGYAKLGIEQHIHFSAEQIRDAFKTGW